jgi:phage terminase Nu1 subunit (DNA packaging protein)
MIFDECEMREPARKLLFQKTERFHPAGSQPAGFLFNRNSEYSKASCLHTVMLCNTKKAVADALQVSTATVANWSKAGCPHLKNAPYDTDAINEWRKQNDARSSNDPFAARLDFSEEQKEQHNDIVLEKQEEELRKVKLQNALLEIEKGVKEERWMLTEDAELSQVRMANEIKNHLSKVPASHCHEFLEIKDEKEAKRKLEKIVNNVLRLLAKKKGK